jgi:N-hydroxyarylamine O-acetyltransferase
VSLDLDAYLRRIRVAGRPRPDLETLQRLHLGHARNIPFENLDIQMGLPISLELPDVEDKLVRRGRGGYCFEQNGLLLAVLREIGFSVEPWEGRTRLNVQGIRPRTHMMLGVKLDGLRYLADVGFGGHGLLHPLPVDGATHEQFGESYRVVTEAGEHVVQWKRDGAWTDLYSLVPETRHPIDFVMGNHFTSTYPSSPFVTMVVVQMPTPEARYALRNLTYSVRRDGKTVERELAPAELRPLLRETFGLQIPDDAGLRALPGA